MLLDLPPELLAMVLKLSLCRHRHSRDEPTSNAPLKANLQLLSICSALRQLSLPLVYQQLFFCCEPAPASETGTANAAPVNQRRAKISTNLDLVVAAGGSHWVREVLISTAFALPPSSAFWRIIEEMRSVAPVWSRVDSFILLPARKDSAMNYREKETGDVWTKLFAVCDALVELMPGLRKLDFKDSFALSMIRKMCGRVAGAAAGQLHKLVVWDIMYLPEDCRLDALRDLRILRCTTMPWRPPRISVDALERLDMAHWTDHDLGSFIDINSGTNRAIVLHKLKSLRSWPYAFDGTIRAREYARQYHQRLHLPALRKLDIWCHTAQNMLWNSAVLPANMDLLDLSITGAASESFAQTTLPKVKHLRVRAYDVYVHAATAIRAINRILVEAGGYESKMLSIEDSITSVHPNSFASTDLTWLQFDGPTSVDDLFGFLQKQPRLRYLNLGRVTVGDTHADMSIPSSDDDRLVAPLHATLDRLAFEVKGSRKVQEKATALAKRLMLGLPALVKIDARQIPKQQLVDFMSEYAHRYPHLAGVNLEPLP